MRISGGAKFGKTPFVDRYMKWRWAVHESYTQAERDNLSARLTEYKKWFLGKKFKVTEPVHVGSIVVLPIENEAPNYRDDLPTEPTLLNRASSWNISPITEGPEITIVTGAIAYQSRIPNRPGPMQIRVSVADPPDMNIIAGYAE
ncbi:uncharacterized protein K489DRAFT_371510 [Dissoconium aciculare CBS 342.82]|uniref:Uncharacterized protein n=1 Tax=Dissoconium aciculare CBS 342.82 TaxID=1314786 RepID=A0A6J3M0T2_9PEZI|nr:uncharacterized protein K489DRAFT_371510 [Dissoconium aciculare CBS 342.82]KAF1821498.1 hypothetical protein K489DRAFT_371510 [Dissoconium aciculare CBS 342.82]